MSTHNKKDAPDSSPAKPAQAATATGGGGGGNKKQSINKKTSQRSSSNLDNSRRGQRGSGKIAWFLNIGISLALFLGLVQIFDPTLDKQLDAISNNRNDDVIFQHSLENPVVHGLSKFVQGRAGNIPAVFENITHEEASVGRERVLELVKDAGVRDLTPTQVDQLPKWEDIVNLYGEEVLIYGKDQCEKFRSMVSRDDIIIGVAGMFNTGTNLLDVQIQHNVLGLNHKNIWQVPWGKHRMAYVKWIHTAPQMDQYDKNHVLPIVIIRDPFSWMQSMCKSPYAAKWKTGRFHCPNLVPNEKDREHFPNVKDSFPVTVKFDEKMIEHYTSLVDLWNRFYKEYLKVDYPIMMIRYEDLLFRPAKTLKAVADCVDAELRSPIVFKLESSKPHGSGTDFIKAIAKTADTAKRIHNMTQDDFNYAALNLDSELMQMFRYKTPADL